MDLIKQFKQWLLPIIDSISPYVKEVWGLLNDYAYLRAGILILIGYVVAKFLNKHIPHLLIRLAQHANFSLGEEIAKRTRPFIFQFLFLTGVGLVASSLALSKTEHFIALASVKSLIIIFFIFFLYKLIKLFLRYLCEKDSGNSDAKIIQPTTLPLFENMALLFLALSGIHQVFGAWNIDMTALLASAGIVGLAIGMASKDTLSDVIAGILILTDAPYRVGDIIQVGAQVGVITSIGIRSTRILTKDNVGITIPNGKMGASEVINESTAEDKSLRIKLPIKAAYGINPEIIREIILTAAQETESVLKDKKSTVIVSDFQEEQVTFTLLCWIAEPGAKSSTLAAVREKIYVRFLKDDIAVSIPKKHEIDITKQADLVQQIAITAVPPLDQSITVKEIPELLQSVSIKDIPDLIQSIRVKEVPELTQSVSIKDIPDLIQSITVKEIPELIQSISIKDIPELIQSVAIKEMPELAHSVAIKEIPELIQSVTIKDIPELIQSIIIKEMPDRNGSLSITEIPDLFGTGQARKILKPEQATQQPKTSKHEPVKATPPPLSPQPKG